MATDDAKVARELASAAYRDVGDVGTKVNALREALNGLGVQTAARLDRVDQRLDRLEDKVDAGFAEMRAKFGQVDARFVEMDAKFDQVNAKFDQVDARFVEMNAKFDQVNHGFAEMRAKFDQTSGGLAYIVELLTEHGDGPAAETD